MAMLALASAISTPARGSDLEREARLTEEIEANIFDGEVISLDAAGQAFVAVEMASQTDSTRGVVILLHGRGFHADWPENIGPLRVGLSEAGWHTLSVQMPVLHKAAKYFDYLPLLPEASSRIDTALAYLARAEISPVVLLAHSCGAHMAMYWLDQSKGVGIDAFIGVGMGATDYKQPMQYPFPFASLSIPILDIYGERDYPAVQRTTPERMSLIKQGGNPLSKQVAVAEAEHYFKEHPDALIEAIQSWLESLTL